MTVDFIFCPLCGASKWLTDKTGSCSTGKLTKYNCSGCKNFKYVNVTRLVKHSVLVGITQTVRYSVEAVIKPYSVTVFYFSGINGDEPGFTNIRSDTGELLVSIKSIITFNWYKDELLLDKIKKYILFS